MKRKLLFLNKSEQLDEYAAFLQQRCDQIFKRLAGRPNLYSITNATQAPIIAICLDSDNCWYAVSQFPTMTDERFEAVCRDMQLLHALRD